MHEPPQAASEPAPPGPQWTWKPCWRGHDCRRCPHRSLSQLRHRWRWRCVHSPLRNRSLQRATVKPQAMTMNVSAWSVSLMAWAIAGMVCVHELTDTPGFMMASPSYVLWSAVAAISACEYCLYDTND